MRKWTKGNSTLFTFNPGKKLLIVDPASVQADGVVQIDAVKDVYSESRTWEATFEGMTFDEIVAGEGVERKFPVHSPRVAAVEVKRSSIVRRAKLYFLRDRVGKAVRLKERRRR